MIVTVDRLVAACADDAFDSGIAIRAELDPLAGPGAPVKPAIYEGGQYQLDRRWRGEGAEARAVQAVVIDNVPSQANRLEAALLQLRESLGLPDIVLDLSGLEQLPVHLPRQISAFLMPHRNGDAYLRDALLDGVDFAKTDIGKAVFSATPQDPGPLFQWMPQALLFGFWVSHLGKQRQQTKLARSWVSEIVGYEPATTETKVLGLKGDPFNLSIDDAVDFDPNDVTGWDVTDAAKAGKRKAGDSLAEVGHGQVPVAGAPGGLSFAAIEQRSTVSFAGLRRIWCGDAAANAAGRALLVAIGLAAHVGAFGRSMSLRSGCELRRVRGEWVWLGDGADEALDALSLDEAVELVRSCAARAHSAGLPVGEAWRASPLVLVPKPNLAKAIEKTWPIPKDA